MEQQTSTFKQEKGLKNTITILTVLICAVLFMTSCKGETKSGDTQDAEVKATVTDSLPEGEWNGEYMKIRDPDDENRPKRQSFGSDFLNLGNVNIDLESETLNIDLFEGKKNALSFHTNMIKALIKSHTNEYIELEFRKKGIFGNYKGKYNAASSSKTENGVQLNIKTGKDNIKEYNLTSGTVEILDFSPQNGILEANIDGEFKAQDGSQIKGKGKIKMSFDIHVMVLED